MSEKSLLSIHNLHAGVGEKSILRGVDLEINPGEIHVVMGPNGIGKSTLTHVLMGNPHYKVTEGSVKFSGEDILSWDAPTRSLKGIFMSFQSPVSIPGLKISEYLRNLYNLHTQQQMGVGEFRKLLRSKLEILNMDRSILSRYLNCGFSGGEKKRLEMLQLMLLKPKVALLDEIDSGVDVDAQKTIADVVNAAAKENNTAFLIITHYERLPHLINTSKSHVILDGKIVHSGDKSLVSVVGKEGYDNFRQKEAST